MKKLESLSMRSTKIKKEKFTFSDFEEGLMLAGYLTPKSIEEISDREELEKYEAETQSQAKNIYFKRVVLAAEIVSKLHSEPSLGSVKFQKMVYLCEKAAEMKLDQRYAKQAAGPFDNKFMHSVAKELKKNKWFSVVKEVNNQYTRHRYLPLENCEGYKKYYQNYFHSKNDSIQFIIELFRNRSTDFTELAATVLACVLEIQSKQEDVLKERLLELFYAWSEGKKRFSEKDVLNSFSWLEKNGLIKGNDLS